MAASASDQGILTIMDAKLAATERTLAMTERLAMEAKAIADRADSRSKEPHVCLQEHLLVDLRKEISGWAKWWRGIIVSVFAGLLIMAGWVYSVQAERGRIVQLEKSLSDVSTEIKKIGEAQATSSRKLDEKVLRDEAGVSSQMESLKEALREVLKEKK